MCLYINGKKNHLYARSLALVPMMAPHSIEPGEIPFCEHVILQISPHCFTMGTENSSLMQRIKRGPALRGGYQYELSEDSQAYALLQDLYAHCDDFSKDSYAVRSRNLEDDQAYSALCHIYGNVFSLMSHFFADGIFSISEDILDLHEANLLESVLQAMIVHPEKYYSLEEAAKMINMSYYNFSRTFKRITGQSFTSYQNVLRIRHAELLLKNPSNSVTQVAYQTNFGSLSYFNRIFKSISGVSPSEFRKRHRAK